MKIAKYTIIIICSIILLLFSFIFQIYELDYTVGYQPININTYPEISLSVSANTTSSKSIWIPFFAYVKDEGPYKIVLDLEDLEKKWESLTILKAEYTSQEGGVNKLDFSSNKDEAISVIFNKQLDKNYNVEFFHFYSPGVVPLSSDINLVFKFELSNKVEKKQYEIHTKMKLEKTKRSNWFSFLTA